MKQLIFNFIVRIGIVYLVYGLLYVVNKKIIVDYNLKSVTFIAVFFALMMLVFDYLMSG